jgi:hypothetical protein
MAVRNRSTQVSYVNELNADGVATQKELNDSITTHLADYHSGQLKTKFEDGIEYYYDDVNDRYLSKQIFVMDFSDNDTTTRNIFLYQKKNIRCNYTHNKLPFSKDVLLDKIEVSLNDNDSGNLFNIEDENGNVLYNVNTPDQEYTLIEDVNTLITSEVRVYVNSTTIRRPLVKLWMRLIF